MARREELLPATRAAWDPRLGPALHAWYAALAGRIDDEGMVITPAYLPVPPPPGCVLEDRTTLCGQCGQSWCICATLRAHLHPACHLTASIEAAGGPSSLLEGMAYDVTCPVAFRTLWGDLEAGRAACEAAGLGSTGGPPMAPDPVGMKLSLIHI